MQKERKRLGEMLCEEGRITPQELERALEAQQRIGGQIGRILVAMGALDAESLLDVLSRQLRVPRVSLGSRPVSRALVALLPEELARRHGVMPVAMTRGASGDVIYVATNDPLDREALDEVKLASGRSVVPLLAHSEEIAVAIEATFGGAPEAPRPPAAGEDLALATAWDTVAAAGTVPAPARPIELREDAPAQEAEGGTAAPQVTAWQRAMTLPGADRPDAIPQECAAPAERPVRADEAAGALGSIDDADAKRLVLALARLLVRKGVLVESDLLDELRRR